MKNLFRLSFTILLACMIFVSCSKEENESFESIDNQTVLNNSYSSRDAKINLFDELVENNEVNSVDNFSEYLNNLKFQEIRIISKNINNIVFEINSPEVFVNTKSLNLSNQILTISKLENGYKLSDNTSNFSVSLDTRSSKWSLTKGEQTIPFSELTDEMIDGYEDIIKYPVYSGIIAEFAFKGFAVSESTPVAGRYEGTGIGFHHSLSNVNYFCGNSHSAILASHSGWCSLGVSVSCVFDEHMCVCTADYYSGDDC